MQTYGIYSGIVTRGHSSATDHHRYPSSVLAEAIHLMSEIAVVIKKRVGWPLR